MAADAEICMMAADTMEALGIERGQYVVNVNNRKVLDGALEAIGLDGHENAGRRAHSITRPSTSWIDWGLTASLHFLEKVAKTKAVISLKVRNFLRILSSGY